MYSLSAFFIGLLFGLGLVISNMVNPTKVLNFLDITGNWDPSLMVVMLAAVVTASIGFYFVNKRRKPVLLNKFDYPAAQSIDKKLIIGSAIFGVGWGITGYCPGPSITVLGMLHFKIIYYIVGMVLGSITYFLIFQFKNKGKS